MKTKCFFDLFFSSGPGWSETQLLQNNWFQTSSQMHWKTWAGANHQELAAMSFMSQSQVASTSKASVMASSLACFSLCMATSRQGLKQMACWNKVVDLSFPTSCLRTVRCSCVASKVETCQVAWQSSRRTVLHCPPSWEQSLQVGSQMFHFTCTRLNLRMVMQGLGGKSLHLSQPAWSPPYRSLMQIQLNNFLLQRSSQQSWALSWTSASASAWRPCSFWNMIAKAISWRACCHRFVPPVHWSFQRTPFANCKQRLRAHLLLRTSAWQLDLSELLALNACSILLQVEKTCLVNRGL